MLSETLPLAIILGLGLVFGNDLIAASAGIVLVLRAAGLDAMLDVLQRRALQWGLIFLMISVLAPFSRDRTTVSEVLRVVASPVGLTAVAGGAIASMVSRPGVPLMQQQPEIIIGLMVGTILGVLFLKGIPVGPLAASGVAAILLKFLFGARE